MRVGISLTSRHAVSDVRAGARVMIERAAAARAAGLDSLFVGDHHCVGAPYYQNVPMLGRLLAEWGDAPAGCLFLLPLWNPVLLAEQVGTLAAIARGRFIVQCGLGDDTAQFAAMGAVLRQRPSAFEESLDAVRRLLRGEVVSASRRFRFEGARVAPLPPEAVEYWIGASAPPAIDRAARMAEGWLGSPGLAPDEAARQAAYYRERCAAHGRRPAAVALRRDVYVGESAAEAEQVVSSRRAAMAAGAFSHSVRTAAREHFRITAYARSGERSGRAWLAPLWTVGGDAPYRAGNLVARVGRMNPIEYAEHASCGRRGHSSPNRVKVVGASRSGSVASST